MGLATYRKKRNFEATQEPRGNAKPSRKEPRGNAGASENNMFVMQKHDARRLHYDLRLELDGVLKSWAVTKGPSLVPGEKRLAVAVEDHPLDYGDFEGTIPKGEYGGGTVIVWDRGSWRPLHDPAKSLAKGHLDFELSGEKLKGRWHLVRMARKPREKHENWLLIKGDDEAARDPQDADILNERPESAKTGRSLNEVAEKPAARFDPSKLRGAKKSATPRFIEPALASLVAAPPTGARWLHEIKFDGYRLQARIETGRVTLITRSGHDWTAKFGDRVAAALRALPVEDAVLDGELVVENAIGASDFSALQSDLAEGRDERFLFYLFDVLHLNGYDLRGAPLIQRKVLLESVLAAEIGPLRFSPHFNEDGDLMLRHVCRLGLEGIVSKMKDAPYSSGRGKSWRKAKCASRQEFVIGGYIPSTTSRRAIGSLALGVYEDGALKYVGRVGTGFTAAVAETLFQQLAPLQIPKTPFAEKLTAEQARQLRHVKPDLVAEIEFRAWTADGHLRHASFRGLREDKPASAIVREIETPPETSQEAQENQQENRNEERRNVKLTHPDRLYWPDAGVTKEGLADYYADVWPHIAPFIVGRALAALRCPEGIDGEMFFQKHVWKGAGAGLAPLRDPREPDETLIGVKDLDGLLALAQGAVLEIHPWGSTAKDWERPDILVMDLDPGDDVPWEQVIAAAQEIRDRLQQAGLSAFVKTSGGKGLHVAAPLAPRAEWPEVKAFAKSMAEAMAADSPALFVSTIAKSRRPGKIFVDYLRNQRGATAIAPYSPRARPGAPVSMPLDWDELNAAIGPGHFKIANARARLNALTAMPWAEFREEARPLSLNPPKKSPRSPRKPK
jgi:bifunctional non-homologous end joining protein LigD